MKDQYFLARIYQFSRNKQVRMYCSSWTCNSYFVLGYINWMLDKWYMLSHQMKAVSNNMIVPCHSRTKKCCRNKPWVSADLIKWTYTFGLLIQYWVVNSLDILKSNFRLSTVQCIYSLGNLNSAFTDIGNVYLLNLWQTLGMSCNRNCEYF